MLTPQESRLTAIQCLEHPWFKAETILSRFDLSKPTLDHIKIYTKLDNLKKAIILYISYQCDNADISKYQRLFSKLIQTENSFVEYSKFHDALKDQLSSEQTTTIFNSLDLDDNGKIYYSEFLAATVHSATILKEENLKSAFIFIEKVRYFY